MSASVIGWHADYLDPVPFQLDVLSWLARHGMITDVRIERDGEGAAVVVNKYVEPLACGPDLELPRETLRLPLSALPPKRPVT